VLFFVIPESLDCLTIKFAEILLVFHDNSLAWHAQDDLERLFQLYALFHQFQPPYNDHTSFRVRTTYRLRYPESITLNSDTKSYLHRDLRRDNSNAHSRQFNLMLISSIGHSWLETWSVFESQDLRSLRAHLLAWYDWRLGEPPFVLPRNRRKPVAVPVSTCRPIVIRWRRWRSKNRITVHTRRKLRRSWTQLENVRSDFGYSMPPVYIRDLDSSTKLISLLSNPICQERSLCPFPSVSVRESLKVRTLTSQAPFYKP